MFLILGCGLIFVAQWPRLSRDAYQAQLLEVARGFVPVGGDVPVDPPPDLQALLGGALMGWIFLAPLGFYGLAALSHLLVRPLGGQGTWFGARLALFWSILAAAPGFLFVGLVGGFLGPGPVLVACGTGLLLAFLAIWGMSLWEAERPVPP